MDKQITIQVSESELDDIIFCLNDRATNQEVAPEWREHYSKLAYALHKKSGGH